MNESSARTTISKYSSSILNGQILLDVIPTPPADTIRVFLSSTATDFTDERSAIWQNISPRIREWTRAKYGLEFQLIDLHWEERPDVPEDQLTMDFVRQEVRYCHQTSLGPCFVALIGQRYGRPPLPVLIAQDEFDTIRSSLSRHLSRETRDADILDRYYMLDTNGIPPVYRLLQAGDNINSAAPIGGKLRALPEPAKLKLCEDLHRVRCLLQKGAELSVADGTMEAQAAEKYMRSLLEQEIRTGLGESALVDKRCLVFLRSIVDLAEQAERGDALIVPTIRRYAELLEAGTNRLHNGVIAELSPSSQQMLDLLRENLIEVRLPGENVKQAKVIWRFDKGICPDIYTHRAYLEQLCDIFYSSIIHLIKENIGMQPQLVTEPLNAHERFKWDALHSWYLVQQMNIPDALFIGYDFQLETIRSYIRAAVDDPAGEQSDMIQNRQPLLICGSPGSGKSTMIARLAIAVREWISGCSVIVRFCGLSSATNSLLLILESICRQLEAIIAGPDFSYSTSLPPSEDLLMARMWRLVASVPRSMYVVILFDGIDRLDPSFPGWLPPTLPPNVSIIATVTAANVSQAVRICGMGGILPESNIVELNGLAPDDAVELLNTMLDTRGRRLTIDQSHIFTQVINHVADLEESGCLQPLYISLLANIAETYASDQSSPDTNMTAPLPKSLAEAISYLFDRLEIAHGYTVVSAMFALLSAASCALTDCEIEDVLSLDEAFMAVIHSGEVCPTISKKSTILPIRRAPPVLWIRLRSDLKQFLLATWETGGQTAWWWRHSSIAEAARVRYLREQGDAVRRLHSRLADYWLGAVNNSGTNSIVETSEVKPASAPNGNEAPPAENEIQPPTLQRMPTALIQQPIILQKFGYKTHNVRKLRNLPLQFAGAERWIELSSHCLFSYEWIYHKTCALGLTDVILDYALTSQSSNPVDAIEASLVAEALRDIGKTIDFGVIIGDSPESPKRPAAINCLPTELSSRLLPYADTSENIRSLIVQCDLLGLSHTALLPLLPHPSTPGAALLAELTFRPEGSPISPDCMTLVETPDDQILLFAKTHMSSKIGCFQLPSIRRIGTVDNNSPTVPASQQVPVAQPWDVECSAGRMLIDADDGLVATVDPITGRAIKLHDLSSGIFFGQLIPTPSEKVTQPPPAMEQPSPKNPLLSMIKPATLAKTEISSIELEAGILFVCIKAGDSDCSEIQAYNLRECPDATIWQQQQSNTPITYWTPPLIASVILPGKAAFMTPSPTGQNVFCGVGPMLCIASIENSQVDYVLPAPGRVSMATSTTDENCVLALCQDDPSLLLLSDHARFSAVEALTSDGARIQFDRLRLSPNDSYVAVWNRGIIDILSCSTAKQLNRLVNPFGAPPTAAGVVSNQNLSEMHAFAEVIFTPNEETLIASAGRWLLLWKPVSGQPVARLQAELGVIDRLIPAAKGRLLVSHIKASPHIQVWNLELGTPTGNPAVPSVTPPSLPTLPSSGIDHLPAPIEELTVVADGQLVYAKLFKSQIIGVFSLANGRLVRALEHDSMVVSVVPVASGQFCLVSTVDNVRRNAANRLWDVVDSRVMWRFGNDPGFAVALHKSDCIVHVARMTDVCTIHDPYTVFLYKFAANPTHSGETAPDSSVSGANNRFEVLRLFFEVRYVLSKPFITEDDSRCIFLVAQSFEDRADIYSGRSVCVCDITGASSQSQPGTGIAMFGIPQLSDFVNVSDIFSVQPCPGSPTNVIVFYACAVSRMSNRSGGLSIVEDNGRTPGLSSAPQSVVSSSRRSQTRPISNKLVEKSQISAPSSAVQSSKDNNRDIGFLILDVTSGTVIRCCDHFLSLSSLPLSISSDLHFCIDAHGAMYDLVTCQIRLPSVHERGWPVQAFLNNGKLAVFTEPPDSDSNNRLQVLRTSDCKLVGWVRIWSPITCATTYGKGERAKLLIGCADGSFTAYIVVDRQFEQQQAPEQHQLQLSDVLPNRTTPVAYAQTTELLQLFATGRTGPERFSRTAPLLMYKEGRLVAPTHPTSSVGGGRVPSRNGSATREISKQNRKKQITPPARVSSGLSASTVSYARGGPLQHQQCRPRDFRSAACSIM